MPNVFEIEQQARRLVTQPVLTLVKNIKHRIPSNWGFGIIFFEYSRTAPPTLFLTSTDKETFVDVADHFVRACKKERG